MIRTVVPVEEEGALGALLEELAGDVITKIGFLVGVYDQR